MPLEDRSEAVVVRSEGVLLAEDPGFAGEYPMELRALFDVLRLVSEDQRV
jgi:hypothetical protein